MDQLSTQILLLFVVIVVFGLFILFAVILYQRVGRSRVDHSVEQSASGIVMEDQESIEKKIILEDSIQHISPPPPKDDKSLKFN
ncbi:MAG: hypothetical protein IPJ75_05565 [Ignavibacteriales bacterium]|nr:hypothetical protein [Ignavibacteriales bacterium]